MRAAVYYDNRDVRLEERAKPVAGPGELVFRVRASGICGSDVMEWYRIRRAPIVLGHEVAGDVVEVGEGVGSFRPGDRIVATHHVPCNSCRYCASGHPNVCDTLRRTTFDPGGFAEFVRLPAIHVDRGAFVLPDSVTYEEATFVEPLACVVRGLRVAGFTPGRSVAVLGSGISGILFVHLARALGAARIVATDVHPDRLEYALRFGADASVRAEGDVPGAVRKAIGGHGADLVIVCTAALPALSQAFRCADRGATILLFAPVAPSDRVEVPLHDLWMDGVSIVHSYAGPPADMRAALALIAARRVDVASMITHRLPLSRTQEGFRLVSEAGSSLKVIIEP